MTEENKKEVSYEELLLSQIYTIEALINILERKGLFLKNELIEEIQIVQAQTIQISHEKTN